MKHKEERERGSVMYETIKNTKKSKFKGQNKGHFKEKKKKSSVVWFSLSKVFPRSQRL